MQNYIRQLKESLAITPLKEAVQVEDADYIGTAYGYDVFDIRTWNAAQQFNIQNTENHAGEVWTRNQNTFENNINENTHLYFFVRENTNVAEVAGVKSGNNMHSIHVIKQDVDTATIHINILLENSRANSLTNLDFAHPLPLFLIPGFTAEESNFGLIIQNNQLTTAYKGFVNPAQRVNEFTIGGDDGITDIENDALSGVDWINTIILNPEHLESPNVSGFEGHIAATCPEEDMPESWEGYITIPEQVEWGYGMTDEQKTERAEEIKNAETISVLKYREERRGKDSVIVIYGCKSGREELEIPSDINGKPVIEIAPYAFYRNKDIKRLYIPSTITKIGKEAFGKCFNLRVYIDNNRKNVSVYSNAFKEVDLVRFDYSR